MLNIFIHASNFRKIKRIDNVMDIFKNIHAALPSKLLMVGDGPERPLAEDLTRQYGLEADVRFLGKQEQIVFLGKHKDVRPFLVNSDLYVIPTLNEGRKEGMPMALVEAMSMGIPVLGSNISGVNFVLKDFKNFLPIFKNSESEKKTTDKIKNKMVEQVCPDETKNNLSHTRKDNKALLNILLRPRVVVFSTL